MKKQLFDLPDAPVDGFEVRYFTIRHDHVQEMLLKYHVNSKWDDVCEAKGGADFVDQWQVFVDGLFSARMEYWANAKSQSSYDFATRQEAVDALKRELEGRALRADERAQEYREKAAQVA